MNCEEARAMLAAEACADEAALEDHVAGCAACVQEVERLGALWKSLGAMPVEEPTSALRMRFYESLGAYRDGVESRKRAWWTPAWQMAAGIAVLAIGVAGGFALRGDGARQQVAELREEVTSMRQMVALSLMQQQSASDRLRGVSWAYRAEPSDTEVLGALLKAMNGDTNVNVRLAAVDALRAFAGAPAARQAMVTALGQQNETPMVQVALIDLLVDLDERKAAGALATLVSNDAVNDGVKQRAQWALDKLQ